MTVQYDVKDDLRQRAQALLVLAGRLLATSAPALYFGANAADEGAAFDLAWKAVVGADEKAILLTATGDGLNLGQVLLLRHGADLAHHHMPDNDVLFPDDASAGRFVSGIANTRLFGKLFVQKSLSLACVSPEDVSLVALVLQSAPPSAIPQEEVLQQWGECWRACLADAADMSTSRFRDAASALTVVMDRIAPPPDPRRGVERWMTAFSAQDSANPAAQVVCLSGRTRTLAELQVLQGYRTATGSSGCLPALPHGRRRELAHGWVCAPQATESEQRARLWACLWDKPEVLDLLLADSQRSQRALRLAALRDEAGRSLSALTRLMLPPASASQSGLLKKLEPVLHVSLAARSDGAGIIEQSLDALTQERGSAFADTRWWYANGQGQADDPAAMWFARNLLPGDHLAAIQSWPEAEKDAWRGPSQRQAQVADRLVDAVCSPYAWTKHGNQAVQALAGCLSVVADDQAVRERLDEARAFARLMQRLHEIAARDTMAYAYSQRRSASAPGANECAAFMKHCAAWIARIDRQPLRLNIGTHEWRQLCLGSINALLRSGGREDVFKTPQFLGALRGMDELMQSRAQEREMALRYADEPPSVRARRLGM